MRILVLLYAMSSGGAERFAVDLSNELAERGHQVLVVATDTDAPANNRFCRDDLRPEVQYKNLGARSGHHPKALCGVFRAIRDFKPDIVHANTDLIPLSVPLLLGRKTQYVHTIHSIAEYYLPTPFLKPLYRFLYKRRVKPVTISGYCSRSFRSLYGLENDTVILNGRDCPACSERLSSIQQQVRFFSYGHPVFVHVARFAPPKNQQVLFEAIKQFPQIRLVVIGKDYPDTLKQAIDPAQVMFVGETRQVADYLAYSDFFILSSLFEGLPITILEAMSYGVIPISTPAGGVVDVIRDGENGFLAQGFQAKDLAEAIRHALDSPLDKEKLKEEYRQNYTMKVCADRYEQLFLSLMKQ